MYDLKIYLGIEQASLKPKDDTVKYLTPSELAVRWNHSITTGTLANWRSQKKGPPFVRFGSRVLYPMAKLEVWEAEQLAIYKAAVNDNDER